MRKLFLVFFYFYSPIVFSKPSAEKTFHEAVKNIAHQKGLAMDFTQTVYMKLSKKDFVSEGHAFFYTPNYFNWRVKNPYVQEWRYDGKKFCQFIPEEIPPWICYESETKENKNIHEVVSIVLSPESLLKRYSIKEHKKLGNDWQFELHPKDKTNLEKIILRVGNKDVGLKIVKLFYTDGNYSVYSFEKAKPIEFDQAQYTPPQGVQVKNLK